MKDWNNLTADEDLILGKHYTKGRNGKTIKYVVVHHNAGTLSIQGCYNVWQTREASAHYQVDVNGRIGQLVWDADTAWHAGNYDANCESIGIEHADVSTSPWLVSEATLDNGAHLVAAVCKYYKLGRPQWGVNVFPHSHFSSTACPASLYGSQKDAYMSRAQQWYDKMTGDTSKPVSPSKPAAKPQSVDLNALANAVIRGEYGNGEQRKAKLGSNYDAVMAIVNKKLGASTTAQSKPASVNIDDLARRVIAGEFGSGEARRKALGANYQKVQDRVNQMLGVSSKPAAVNVDDLARRVIRGEFGTGEARKRALGSNYAAVQARVNQMLS